MSRKLLKNNSFDLCLNLLTLSEDFKEFGKLFHNLGPTYEIFPRPLLVFWFGIHNLFCDLRVIWLCCMGRNISETYRSSSSKEVKNGNTCTLFKPFIGWKPIDCPCRICKIYIPNIGFLWRPLFWQTFLTICQIHFTWF